MENIPLILMVIGGLTLLLLLVSVFYYGHLYVKAVVGGVSLNMWEIISMRLMNVDPSVIVKNLVIAEKAGLDIKPRLLEAHYLAGGDVSKVIEASVLAKKKDIPLSIEFICGMDLEDEEMLQRVRDLQGCGRAASDIDPYGRVEFGDKQYDAITEGEDIDAGEEVRITGEEKLNLLVRPA